MNDCFKVYPTAMNWTQAKSSCESVGSSLVSILNVYEQAFLDIITVDFSTPVWIGLADQGVIYTATFEPHEKTYVLPCAQLKSACTSAQFDQSVLSA